MKKTANGTTLINVAPIAIVAGLGIQEFNGSDPAHHLLLKMAGGLGIVVVLGLIVRQFSR